MNTTTRKFPRTMDEAFPRTVEYGCAITKFERKVGQTAVYIACAIGFVAAIAACLYT